MFRAKDREQCQQLYQKYHAGLQGLAEHGFVGILLHLALVASSFTTAHRLVKRARFQGDLLVANYAKMFRFSIVGFLVSGLFLGRAYFDYYFTIVACLIILEAVAKKEWAQSAEVSAEEEDEPVREDTLVLHNEVAL